MTRIGSFARLAAVMSIVAAVAVPSFAAARGKADFTRFVAIGDSYGAGFEAGSLNDHHQPFSWPAFVAKQVGLTLCPVTATITDNCFAQPLISYPGLPGGETVYNGVGLVTVPGSGAPEMIGFGRPYNNLAVPGYTVGATLALTHAGKVIVSPLDVHPSLAFVFAVPEFVLETKRARAALPNVVPHVTAVSAAAKGAALVRGLATADEAMLAAALDDVLHIPHRRRLVRGYDAVAAAAVEAGAIGATLSGAGSSMLAVTKVEKADAVGAAMAHAWQLTGVSAVAFSSAQRVKGFHVVA